MPPPITVTASIEIGRPPEEVFDFTQDYARRPRWDRSVRSATVLAALPLPRVQVRASGLDAIFQYKQFARPAATSLVMEEVRSPLVAGGGGAWSYRSTAGGTLWTQTNTIVLREGLLSRLLAPLIRRGFERSVRGAMARAKELLEAGR